MRTHDRSVHEQFDPRAAAYLTSAVHASGPDLAAAAARVAAAKPRLALDVGCGAGHLSFALSPHVEQIIAFDPSESMLATVRGAALERGLGNVTTTLGHAEQLPWPVAHFDLVCSRYSAHHWRDVPGALREMRRVLVPGGALLMLDFLGEENALVDTWMQAIELLRDPSHVRDRSIAEWSALLAQAGFQLLAQESFPLRIQFGPWVERMRTPPVFVSAIRALQERASEEVRVALQLEPDGSFTGRTGLFWARAC